MLLAKAVNLLAVVALAFWFGEAKSWPAFGALAASLVSLVALDRRHLSRPVPAPDPDAQLFSRFLECLPYDGAIGILERTDMAGPIRYHALDQLREFIASWADEAHRFHDDGLDQRRVNLLVTTQELLVALARDTFPVGPTECCAVPSEWSHEQPDRFREVSTRLNRLASEVFKQHQELVRYGRRKLRV